MAEDLTHEEQDALAVLGQDHRPSADLEDRVVAAMRQRRLIAAPATSRWLRGLAAAAALLVAFWLGGLRAPATSPGNPAPAAGPATTGGQAADRQFLLLLHGDPGGPLSAEAEAAVVAEYAAWARELRGQGRLRAGEKLEEVARAVRGERIEASAALDPTVTGFFIVYAESADEAMRIALDCPHARRGGRVEVREIARS